MFSSKTLAAFDDPTIQEQFEEGAGIDEFTIAHRKADKKKKKKKQTGKDTSGASGRLVSDEASSKHERNYLGNIPKPCPYSESLRGNQTELQNTQLPYTNVADNTASGLLAVGTHFPNMADTVMKQPSQLPKVGVKHSGKKKKKKKATQGVLQPKVSTPKPEEACIASGESQHFEENNSSLTEFERFSNDITLLSKDEREKQNFLQVLILLYGKGLIALRDLFKEIHPTWANTPGDALNLEKGVMQLKGHERALFNDGNIEKWDVSLITTVLKHSKKCKDEISKRPKFEDAIHSIKDNRNRLAHVRHEKMSDADFQVYWSTLSKNFETLGVSKESIAEISIGNVLEKGKVYRDLFLEEISSRSAGEQRIYEEIQQLKERQELANDKLDLMISQNQSSDDPESKSQLSPRYGGPNWDEWMKFRDNLVRNFDHLQNNYILVTDAMSPELMECFSVFRSVPWKMVLDFDSSSEEKGMYQDFTSKDGTSSLISMITPGEIRRLPFSNLARHIDAKKTQWMFVNGRKSDGPDGGSQEFEEWEDVSVKEITKFFGCFSEPDKFDKNMPVICLLLPFRKESVPFVELTLKRLKENFNEFNLKFVGTKQDQSYALSDRLLKKINLGTTDLEPRLLRLGMEKLFHISSEQSYCMPTSQANAPAKLTQKEYLYLKEYLDVLYEGCEDTTDLVDDDEELDNLIEEHKKSFMSGNWISFLSLSYNHDAKREISNEIRTHIQRLLDQGPTHSSIVEISHSPGSGGTTIARRVMWDIHKSYPCVFAKLEDQKNDLEDDSTFLDNLADRIILVQDKCYTTPVVLLDGKHASIEALSSRLARNLNSKGRKAVLLRCNHTSGESKNQSTPESSDVHARFPVNVKLEQSKADLKEFEDKYKDYIEDFKKIKSVSGLSRVFHFPLLAMLEDFRGKLQRIVFESFDEMEPLEKEIVLVVAFLQKYAAQATPAPLLYAAFKNSFQQSSSHEQAITYEDISKIITEPLSNLMVPANPSNSIHRRRYGRTNYFQEMYTLQHPVVAELVLKKAKMALKQDTMAITRDFLGFPIYDDIRFIPLMKNLFVLHGCAQGRFSLLFEELKAMNPKEAGELFCEAADKTKDVAIVTSAARFFANLMSPNFRKAKELIDKAFECRSANDKLKRIYDVKGVVLSKEMRFLSNQEQINSLQELQDLAQKALSSFRKAKSYSTSFPNPRIGEVKTWLTCIDWITKNRFNGDSNKTLEFITSHEAPFFQTCISDSFRLLNTVDEIVQSATNLPDPDKTQREANSLRLGLMKTIRKSKQIRSTEEAEVIEACQALCSAEFPASSELELKRLQVQYLLSSVKQMENLSTEVLQYLMELLTELVEVEKDAVFAKHLMKVCVHIDGFSLDRGLDACEIWSKISNHDPFPYFYEMMVYFLKILDGRTFEYRSKYHEALDNCRGRSQHNYKKMMSRHFLGKAGEGMSRLMTKVAFFRGETEYKSNMSEVAEAYWKTKSRKKLLECCGRIRSRASSSGKKDHYVIELLQGNVELYVARKAGLGAPDLDFVPGSMVYFVVSFNLLGPVANGITFKPSTQSDTEEQ